jgi:hypothetical protein
VIEFESMTDATVYTPPIPMFPTRLAADITVPIDREAVEVIPVIVAVHGELDPTTELILPNLLMNDLVV